MVQPPQTNIRGKYDNYGTGGYFRIDDGNKFGYKYILSIT